MSKFDELYNQLKSNEMGFDPIRRIRVEDSTFDMLKQECEDYIEGQDNIDERIEYSVELDRCRTIAQLVNSGVFHDACGKLVEYNDKEIVVSEEY